MKKYLDEVGLQDFATKLTQKYKSIFAARGEAGTPIPVETVAEMTDTDQIYVYTGTETGYTAGNWYYYDGSAWVSGGSYGAGVTDDTLTIEGRAADAKATGDAIHATQSMIAPREASTTATRNYSVGDLVIVGDVLYRVTAAIASGETITPGTNVTADTVAEELAALEESKADKDGTILNAVNAEQITAKTRVKDEKPYVFRASGGGAEIGDRAFIDKIVGGTVAWNQIIADGNFPAGATGWSASNCTLTFSDNIGHMAIPANDSSATAKRIGQSVSLTSGHKYLRTLKLKSSLELELKTYAGASGAALPIVSITPAPDTWVTIADIVNCGSTGSFTFLIGRIGTIPEGGMTVDVKDVMLIDLTQMFGATIADYIAALETANEGAGIAWFKSLFPADYYAYDAGTLRSVNAAAHKTVGFNAFDKSTITANSRIGSAGIVYSDNNTDLSDYIECLPSTDYYFRNYLNYKINVGVAYFDGSKNFIGHSGTKNDDTSIKATSGAKTTPANCHYLRINIPHGYLDTCCVSLRWDGERDGEYEPYSAHTYALDDTLTLRGIPKLDANNALYYDGDEYAPDGTVTRRYGTRAYEAGDEALTGAITDGTNTVYELTTPTTEAAAPYTSPQIVDNWGTEEYTDAGVAAGTRDVAIPVGHVTEYPPNLRAKLEAAPDSPDADGDYIMRRSGGANGYAVLTKELPTAPSEDGTYRLVCTVSGGEAAYSWEAVT